MRSEKYTNVLITGAAVLVSLCMDQYPVKKALQAATQPKVTIAETTGLIPMRLEQTMLEQTALEQTSSEHMISDQMISDQNSQTTGPTTRAVIDRFNEAFNRHDADALAAWLTDDTVFEDTSPAPDGRRIDGKPAVVAFWRTWFTKNGDAVFETEDVIVSGDRAVVLWVYRKRRNGQPWHLRGVDVFTVRDGKVAAKLAYVKG